MSLESLRAFISYSRKDKLFVEPLVSRLQNRCVSWWDQRLAPAEVWWATILEKIEWCDCFVLILTPAYNGSVFCLTELEYAQKLGKPILPVVPDKAVKFPPGVAHSQAAFLSGFVVAEAVGEILIGLSGLKPGQYAAPGGSVSRPPEPTPTGQAQVSNLYADAVESEAAGNLALAERFYELVARSDPGRIGKLATAKLKGLREARNCRDEYENIVRLAANPKTLNDAVELWQMHVEQCGTAYDEKGFARDPRFNAPTKPTPRRPTSFEIMPPPPVAWSDIPADKVHEQAPPPAPTKPALKRPTSLDLMPPPFAWIDIPTGRVTLIPDESATEKSYIEKNTIFEVPAFTIAKYPLANAQFKKFIEAGGYTEQKWWTTEGWRVKRIEKWKEPRYWKGDWKGDEWNRPDCPVVGVSWFEAVAFCLWLSDITGERITLPTEQQWQRAAQGKTNRVYPWGDEFDKARCNTHESRIGRTTPVESYPAGASPYGVMDMSGNVREWCLTNYESGAQDIDIPPYKHVLRGGSWYNEMHFARATYRDWFSQKYWSDNAGFRLVSEMRPPSP